MLCMTESKPNAKKPMICSKPFAYLLPLAVMIYFFTTANIADFSEIFMMPEPVTMCFTSSCLIKLLHLKMSYKRLILPRVNLIIHR